MRIVTQRSRRPVLALFILVDWLVFGTAAGRVHAIVRLDDGKVTARLARVPLRSAVEELARLWGARVEWRTDPGQRDVSAEFVSLPAEDALARLLQRRSFYVIYASPVGLPRRIVVLGPCADESDGPVPGAPGPAADARLDDAAPPGSLNPAVEAVLADPSADVRLRMLDTVVALDADDPRRRLVLDRLVADPDPRVREAALHVDSTMAAPQPLTLQRTARLRSRRGPR